MNPFEYALFMIEDAEARLRTEDIEADFDKDIAAYDRDHWRKHLQMLIDQYDVNCTLTWED